ncbi:MAG: glycoside hydrolase family 9 protein, partial [Spirochaetota bacterium]
MRTSSRLHLNELDYLETRGLNVMLAHDYYPDGHQGGVSIIQNGLRVATNGDLRLDRTPGQWSPVPKAGEREVDRETDRISVRMSYPDEEKNRTGFNPIDYPDLELGYRVSVRPLPEADDSSFRITVDLEAPLPDEWAGRVAFMLELFPGFLFGRSYSMDGTFGVFPRQANGPGAIGTEGVYQVDALATGRVLTVAPESDRQRMRIESHDSGIELVDGRALHNNGWFIVRSPVPAGATSGAVEWTVTPNAIPGWTSEPVVQVSQVGYHPDQPKYAIVEIDRHVAERLPVVITRIHPDGRREEIRSETPPDWGRFLRYDYLRLDFSDVREPGLYVASYGEVSSNPFRIASDVFARHVWQPTLEYFLPIQMCHVRVTDRSRVWHGACHLDDARMAPTDHNHFDGYVQGASTLCDYEPGEHVPGLNSGGWHDAGDHDLRVESQANTVYGLALAWEEFGVRYDATTVDQEARTVELHRPDGIPDILQQIEHGCRSILGAYRALGRLYRGIIVPNLRQYTILGDPVNQTDGHVALGPAAEPGSDLVRSATMDPTARAATLPDDRWVFTEENPQRELQTAAALATAARALRELAPELADECVDVAVALYDVHGGVDGAIPAEARVTAEAELFLSTGERRIADALVAGADAIAEHFGRVGWVVGRTLEGIGHEGFSDRMAEAARAYRTEVDELERKTPYGVPYEPNIWGAGWGIQHFGMQQYFLHRAYPEVFPLRLMLHALNFVLGCHPGSNTASFVSGVGARSLEVAYGFNRDDWAFIPGGSASGTALIRPDYPELLEWPHLWQ